MKQVASESRYDRNEARREFIEKNTGILYSRKTKSARKVEM